jgi:hypothetical protein
LFFKPFHSLLEDAKKDFMDIKIYPEDIYDIYINSNNKSIEIIDIFTLYGLNLKRNGK